MNNTSTITRLPEDEQLKAREGGLKSKHKKEDFVCRAILSVCIL